MYLSTKEAARLLGLSTDAVRRMIRTGKLKAIKEKGVYKIPEEEIERIRGEREAYEGAHAEDMSQLIQVLRERIRELEADKAFLQERIMQLEKWLEEERQKALPPPKGESWFVRLLARFKRKSSE